MGLPDVSHYPELFVALLDSGTWSLEDLSKLAGLNFLRVLREVEKVTYIFKERSLEPSYTITLADLNLTPLGPHK